MKSLFAKPQRFWGCWLKQSAYPEEEHLQVILYLSLCFQICYYLHIQDLTLSCMSPLHDLQKGTILVDKLGKVAPSGRT